MCLAPGLASCPGCCPLGVTDAPTRRRTSTGVSSTQPQGQCAPLRPTLRHGMGGSPQVAAAKPEAPVPAPHRCLQVPTRPLNQSPHALVSLWALHASGTAPAATWSPLQEPPHVSPSNPVSVKEHRQHLRFCSLSPWDAVTCPCCSDVSLLLKTL